MRTILLLTVFISATLCVKGQTYTAQATSTNGYTVDIIMELVSIDPSTTNCPHGYNYNLVVNYTVVFSGSNQPGSLWTLQGNIGCGPHSHFYSLPNGGGSGSLTTGSNQYSSNSDCNTSTPASMGCNSVTIQIQGPGIPNQTITASSGGTLPIELIRFDASKAGNNVDLEWTTATEINNSHFTIERSTDGFQWTEVGIVEGQGNSSNNHTYKLTDDALYAADGIVYYRLKQTDFDGTESDYFIRKVVFDSPMDVSVYPNPAQHNINIEGAKGAQVSLYDSYGRQVIIDMQNQGGGYTIDVSSLPRGAYVLTIRTTSETVSKQIILS